MKPFDIEQAKQAAEAVAKKHGLSFVALFGSQATGRTHEKSDIDMAVLGKRGVDIRAAIDELDNFFGDADIKVLELDEELPIPKWITEESGIVLCEEAPDTLLRWKMYANRVWREMSWLRNMKKWVEAVNKLPPNWRRRDFMLD